MSINADYRDDRGRRFARIYVQFLVDDKLLEKAILSSLRHTDIEEFTSRAKVESVVRDELQSEGTNVLYVDEHETASASEEHEWEYRQQKAREIIRKYFPEFYDHEE